MCEKRCICQVCGRVYYVQSAQIDKDGYANWKNHFHCGPVCCSLTRDRLAGIKDRENDYEN